MLLLFGFGLFETFFQIAQRPKAMAFVFSNPTLVDLMQRHRIEIMQLLAPAPHDGDEVCFSSNTKCLVTACRVMSRCSHNSLNVCPFSLRSSSSNFLRLAVASALKTASIRRDYATKWLHVKRSIFGYFPS